MSILCKAYRIEDYFYVNKIIFFLLSLYMYISATFRHWHKVSNMRVLENIAMYTCVYCAVQIWTNYDMANFICFTVEPMNHCHMSHTFYLEGSASFHMWVRHGRQIHLIIVFSSFSNCSNIKFWWKGPASIGSFHSFYFFGIPALQWYAINGRWGLIWLLLGG